MKTRSMSSEEGSTPEAPTMHENFQFFAPFQNLLAPPIPYRIGSRFQASVYIPEGLQVAEEQRHDEENFKLLKGSNGNGQPENNSTSPGQTNFSIELEIQGLLRVGTKYKSQLVMATMENSVSDTGLPSSTWSEIPRNTGLVAKFFDTCYPERDYNDLQGDTEERYLAEAQTYQALVDLQGTEIPKFYGSYSVSFPLRSHPPDQNVPMLLMESIKGVDMSEINRPLNLPQKVRQKIMRDIVDLESRIFAKGIAIQHLAMRNIMLTGPDNDNPRVVFLDFERAGARFKRFQRQYIPPALRWRQPLDGTMYSWIDWEWLPWIKKEFPYNVDELTPEVRELYRYHLDPMSQASENC